MNPSIIRILLSLCLALFLSQTGCGDDTTTSDGPTDTPTGPGIIDPGSDAVSDPATTCVDLDGDGFLGFVAGVCDTGDDCDDNNASAYPGAAEVCGNNVDNACNGDADEDCCIDLDGDTYPGWSLSCPEGTDCDDTKPTVYPGATEVEGNNIDEDCDGYDLSCVPDCVDKQCGDDGCGGVCGDCGLGAFCTEDFQCDFESAPEGSGSCAGQCATYVAGADCQCDSLCVSAGDCCEDLCDECGTELPEQCGCQDLDGDTYGAGPECAGPDCNDEDADVYPGAEEIACNGKDDNCDEIDFCEEVEDTPEGCNEELDKDGDGFCTPEDCDDNNGDINPGAADECDKTDNNCDGVIDPCPELDCIDQDGDGYGEGTQCANDEPDCNDQNPTVNPGASVDFCGDGIDQDCDGADAECPSNCVDDDNDGFFKLHADCEDEAATDCVDDDNTIFPGATDICGDGIDQNCDNVDEVCPEPTGCTGNDQCDAGYWCDTTIGDGECSVWKYWQWWAPEVYVDTASNESKLGWDFFTTVDFDGTQKTGDNGDNIDSFDKPARVYYSYVKTSTHAYLGYHFYFPRRWDDAFVFATNYENVMRSVLLTIRIDTPGPNGMGELELMQTTGEDSIWHYGPEDSELSGFFAFNGDIHTSNDGGHDRPIIYIDSQTHNITGHKGWENGFPGDNGYIFRWSDTPGTPTDLIGESTYDLISLNDTVWQDRNDLGDTKTFETFGIFAGDDASNSESVAPWAITDEVYISGEPAGELLYDPASFVRRYFPIGWDLFYTDYVYNPYALRVDIIDLQVMDTGGWFDGDVDPYINLYLRDGKGTERKLLSDAGGLINNWKSSSIPMGEIIDIKDELGRWWYYGISHPGKDYFGIEVRDADVWFDDWLMEPAERDYQTFTGTQLIDWEKSNSIITVDAP